MKAWIDASAGIAGDMLLGALLDAGADLAGVQEAVDAVIAGSVRLTTRRVDRAGQSATKLDVELLVDNPPHRTWATIRTALEEAELPERTRELAVATFARLAEAEGRVHGIPAPEVHFHEVGALDSIADVVGACDALRQLGITQVGATPVALGSGRIHAAHGFIPVPVPAVAQLSIGWPVLAAPITEHQLAHAHPHSHSHSHDQPHEHAHSHDHPHSHSDEHDHPPEVDLNSVGELATPTGLALLRTIAAQAGPLPALTPSAVGVGAGTKDTALWPNVVRVVLAGPTPIPAQPDAPPGSVAEVSATIDDLDPRLWPGVLSALLDAGAVDAWATPTLMKKGRPGHVVTALVAPEAATFVEHALLAHTTTLGVRRSAPMARRTQQRAWQTVTLALAGTTQQVWIKVGHDGTRIATVTPEFTDVERAARAAGVPQAHALHAAAAAAAGAGLVPGARMEP